MNHSPTVDAVEIDGIPLSYRASRVHQPRAVVLALHGGGTDSSYFDCPGRPRLSLLHTGAALGFTVIALDRPGYGASHAHQEKLTDPARRVELTYAALDQLLTSGPYGAGVFLMAHSAGSELAIRMAAEQRGTALLGLEIAGTGRQHHPRFTARWAEHGEIGVRRPARRRMRDLLWGPSRLYPPDVFGGTAISATSPAYEFEARDWVREFAELAARVRIPVQYTLGDHEAVWRPGPPGLAEIAALFTASPRVRLGEQPDSGHNLSLGYAARAYHLRVLSFAEECAVRRENADPAEGVHEPQGRAG
ncbi:alpha/beta fold hydrolase [Streptomyces sp. GESEQ-35]|uniref:alpha/beta fold hydrolase n=1 Tax=Streptomyces sp. GESEQ-35 TaxID=2812657 RepID=UPI001B3190C3|nr:alpha/beta fold hydrolase [Streptomyces sp. GESEQ-35]